ncbi:hypothetical protein ACI7YT_12545 [Microbacterium sp. M]|uniref:hypothetical protein n=1 Tax=Microbacterium sp. M TaxID=3377125 RepID=UPI0038657CFE
MATDDGTAERVREMTADAEAWMSGLFRKIDKAERKGNDDKADRLREEMDSYGHSVHRVVSIVLAGGGPSHRLNVTLDSDGDVIEVESIASWGFTHKATEIREGSALWRYAEEQTSHYGPMREGE